MKLLKCLNRLVLTTIIGLVVVSSRFSSAEQEAKPEAEKQQVPIAKSIIVKSPVDGVLYGRVKNVALELQNQAEKEQRRAILILRITPGSSQFHQVQGLAKFLTSTKLSQVTTVAWIPKTVKGNNVVLALACKEIIMHPDAELGDIGRGQALDKDEQQAVLSLVEKRHNIKLSPALVLGMMDPQQAVLKIKVQMGPPGQETTESQIVTPKELRLKLENKVVILDVLEIKDPGITGTFSGKQARALGILVVQTAESRDEIAKRYNLPREALREEIAFGEAPRVRLIKVDGMIEPILQQFIERQIERSVADGANLLIFEIDSPGGLVFSSEQLANAIASLDSEKVRTVAYIPREALSGAAMIALGCDEIYMHPGARMGDIIPIQSPDGQRFEKVPAKILTLVKAMLAELAEKKNRPPALAEAMSDAEQKVYRVTHPENGRVWYMSDARIREDNVQWIKGPMVAETDDRTALIVYGKRAHELLLAEPPVEDFEDLKQRLGIPPGTKVPTVGRNWVDTLLYVLNYPFVTGLLFVIGGICIYLELHFMTGLLGIISALCFSLFFWSRFLNGTAGWLEVILFLLGLGCIGLEIFVIPGFGVFGVSGGLLLLSSLILASQTWGNLEPNADFTTMSKTVGTLIASILSVVVMAMLMSRYLPHMPLLNQMILSPPGLNEPRDDTEPRLRPKDADGELREQLLVGEQGTAMSILRPAGKAEIAGRFLDVVSEGPYIQQGAQIEVIEVSGNRIVVREA